MTPQTHKVTDAIAAGAHIGIKLLWEKVLSQFQSGAHGGAHHNGGGHIPLPRPAQSVQGTHDWTKSVLNAPNRDAISGAEHCPFAQGSPILNFLPRQDMTCPPGWLSTHRHALFHHALLQHQTRQQHVSHLRAEGIRQRRADQMRQQYQYLQLME